MRPRSTQNDTGAPPDARARGMTSPSFSISRPVRTQDRTQCHPNRRHQQDATPSNDPSRTPPTLTLHGHSIIRRGTQSQRSLTTPPPPPIPPCHPNQRHQQEATKRRSPARCHPDERHQRTSPAERHPHRRLTSTTSSDVAHGHGAVSPRAATTATDSAAETTAGEGRTAGGTATGVGLGGSVCADGLGEGSTNVRH